MKNMMLFLMALLMSGHMKQARNTLTTQIIAIKAGRVVTVAIRGMPVRTG